MKNKLNKILATLFFSAGLYTNANAALIGVQDHDNYFTDTNNGVDWLDVTLTTNRSFNDISSQLGAGGEFEGWRYATAQEFTEMLNATTGLSTGLTGANQNYNGENELFAELIALFGSTIDQYYIATYGADADTYHGFAEGTYSETLGILADYYNPHGSGFQFTGQLRDDDRIISNIDILDTARTNFYITPTHESLYIGSYLVREAKIPEPTVISLLALGLAGIALARRKKEKL
ncbi:PEP-CTERM sorting domain-containing protein [Pseudomonadota bacterium]